MDQDDEIKKININRDDKNYSQKSVAEINADLNTLIQKVSKIFNNAFSGISKQVSNIIIDFQKYISEIDLNTEGQSAFMIYAKSLHDAGWCVQHDIPINSGYFGSFSDKTKLDIDKQMVSYFTRNDFCYLYSELSGLAEGSHPKFKKQIYKMINILKSDINNYTLAIPVLYSWLEFEFWLYFEPHYNEMVKEKGKRQVSNIANKYNLETSLRIEKELQKETGRKGFYQSSKIFTLNLTLEHFVRSDFDSDIKTLNRHAVLHGRMFPDDYKFIEFLKLVSLCNSFTIFN